jgi:hypothetical protein
LSPIFDKKTLLRPAEAVLTSAALRFIYGPPG